MNERARYFALSLLVLVCWGSASAAGLDVSLDRTRIVEGESLVLTLSAPADAWGGPDLTPLMEDFEVTNQGQSTRMTVINGRSSSTREWQLLLGPKRSGTLTIPALELGNLSSEPLIVEVLPVSQAAELGETLPVMVEVEVDQHSPYVQAQVVYRVRLLSRVSLHQGNLTDPAADGVIVERLGEDRQGETYRNGQRYQVIERSYALFPQHSGAVRIAAPVLTGEVPEQRQDRDGRGGMFGGALSRDFERFFGRDPFEDMGTLFQRTRPIRVGGRELELEVRPRPSQASLPWLPAESVQLAETWSPELTEVRAGEPVTRTIAITAQGLTDAQLPDLQPPVPESVKSYPDRPRVETRTEGDDVLSLKEVKLALVPSTEGELTLPEVRLAWWDTKADRERIAALPARVVRVLPASAGAAEASLGAASPPGRVPDEQAAAQEVTVPGGGEPEGPGVAADTQVVAEWFVPVGPWPWIAGGLGLAWIATLGLWLGERRRTARAHWSEPGSAAPRAAGPSLAEARARIKRACAGNDPGSARQGLLDWAAANWPEDPPRGLEALGRALDESAEVTLRELDRCCYASGEATWDGAAAWGAIAPALARAAARTGASEGESAGLPPLYPRQA